MADDLARMIAEWNRFAAHLERGFSDGIDDYSYYLNTRDVIEDALESEPATSALRHRLAHIDSRVRAATRLASPMRTLNTRPGSIEFYSRAPRIVLPELREDLFALGLMDWIRA
jgi:hypothetical protein